jgi:hypothetical protein
VNSDGKTVQVRDIAEDHVAEDFGGKIPTIQEWLSDLPVQPWMRGHGQKVHAMKLNLEVD